jgi:MoxR-like ATPase
MIKEIFDKLQNEIGKIVVGQHSAIEQTLVAFFAGGHVLLEGVPGLGKTLLARTLAQTLELHFKRIQFTPDLMPSDIIGTNVFDMAEKKFHFVAGPLFSDVLLADEINRTPPKTQAALLQAMEEREVTVDGISYGLPSHFFVIATQNPIEAEGTFPMPEAQLDRFLMKVRINYPSHEEEMDLLRRSRDGQMRQQLENVIKIADASSLAHIVEELKNIRIEDPILEYVARLAAASRRSSLLALGASPRAALNLAQCARVLAGLRGRDFVTPDDVKDLALPVFRHRFILKAEAEIEGQTQDRAVESVLAQVEVPR